MCPPHVRLQDSNTSHPQSAPLLAPCCSQLSHLPFDTCPRLLPAEATKRAEKRQKTGEGLRPYDGYTEQDWQRQESWLWSRRREPLQADKAGRKPEKMPRGHSDGPLHHWRRGLVGAVQDWAEGSKADAATLVLSLIKELELEVSCSFRCCCCCCSAACH